MVTAMPSRSKHDQPAIEEPRLLRRVELPIQLRLQLVDLLFQHRRRSDLPLNSRYVVRRNHIRSWGPDRIKIFVGVVKVRKPDHKDPLILVQNDCPAPCVVDRELELPTIAGIDVKPRNVD